VENIEKTNSFKHLFPIQVRWDDLDPLGHVNNARYLTYFELARGQYIQAISPTWNWTRDMFLIASATVNFEKELRMTAKNIAVSVRASKIGQKSFVLDYILVSENDNKQIIHASGSTTQVMIDMKLQKTIEIPEWFRTILNEQLTLTN